VSDECIQVVAFTKRGWTKYLKMPHFVGLKSRCVGLEISSSHILNNELVQEVIDAILGLYVAPRRWRM
jgi:hypothetical protein